MHRMEAEKQRQSMGWLDVFLPAKVQQGSRGERYRLGILVMSMLWFSISSLIFALQSLRLPMPWSGKLSACLMALIPVAVLLYVRWTGQLRSSAVIFGLLALPLAVMHIHALQTIHIGFFYWVPWLILFVSLMVGRRLGLMMTIVTGLVAIGVLQANGIYGHSFGIYGGFREVFYHILENQILSALAITVMMLTLGLSNDRMEAELESQHVLRAQIAHKTMIGEMLGNLAHEVNNPLAIVHTALVHYQRLLHTKRLEKSMQHGLMDRMSDALDRLWHVVEDLNSAADWSELERPRSYASLQSDQDRAPQFGNSRWNSNHEGAVKGERRRRRWVYWLMRRGVGLLDLALPRITYQWSTSQRFRARATALICTLGLIAMAANVMQQLAERVEAPVLFTGFVVLAIGLLGMIVLKLVPRPQIIGVGYILLLFVVIAGLAGTSGRSILVPALHWFPVMIASLFLVTRPRTAVVIALVLLGCHVMLMQYLQSFGLQLAFTQSFPQYVARLQSTLLLVCLTTLFLSIVFIALMDSTYSQLVAEKDWHLLSARMRELNELADSAAILIGEPLRSLGQRLSELQNDGHNGAILIQMQASVDRIIGVSQSFALLSRPKIAEDIQTIEGRVWMDHIHNICFRRAAEAGWNLSTRVEPQDGVIIGPLGRLTMLVITGLKEAFGHRAPRPKTALSLYIFIDPEVTRLWIHYEASPPVDSPRVPQEELEEAMRLSLLHELMESLQASATRRQEGSAIILELRWRHANFRLDPLP